jgi:hypothetical protein
MDYLRSCYSTSGVMTTDGQQFPMEWYFVDPSTPKFGRNRFGSLNYRRPGVPSGLVGEVNAAPRPWRDGSRPMDLPPGPLYPVTGDPAWFTDGAPPSAVNPPVWGGAGCPFAVMTPCEPFPLPARLRVFVLDHPGCFLWGGDQFDLTYLGSGIWGADDVVNLAPGFGRLYCRLHCEGFGLWRMNISIGTPVDPSIGVTGLATITSSPLTFDMTVDMVPVPPPFSLGPCCSDPGTVRVHVFFPF